MTRIAPRAGAGAADASSSATPGKDHAPTVAATPPRIARRAGSGGRFSIGVTVFAGVTFGTLFTLFVVPVAYDRIAKRTKLPGNVAKRIEDLEADSPIASRGVVGAA